LEFTILEVVLHTVGLGAKDEIQNESVGEDETDRQYKRRKGTEKRSQTRTTATPHPMLMVRVAGRIH
jgi:hypothetical protein